MADAAIAAVLEAMQEPSEGMLDEMHGRVRILVDPGQRSADIQNDREVWKAMLAAFREEQLGDSQAGDARLTGDP
ncbi:hypothetical protein [Novosphingobium sp. HII-3]|uniref:hypothetical protein n=1 Tax=Novosphingobium sp. HII-3 TaxID=2075565 RepID=UPI0011AF1B30|nr:hypothetical protein [Novosphingobium sp. HII-3]